MFLSPATPYKLSRAVPKANELHQRKQIRWPTSEEIEQREQIHWSTHQYGLSFDCTVVSYILTADRIELISFFSDNNLSGCPKCPVVG